MDLGEKTYLFAGRLTELLGNRVGTGSLWPMEPQYIVEQATISTQFDETGFGILDSCK